MGAISLKKIGSGGALGKRSENARGQEARGNAKGRGKARAKEQVLRSRQRGH